MNVFNIAQGEFIILGAYITYFLYSSFGIIAFDLFLTRTRRGNLNRALGMDMDAARLTDAKIAPTLALTFRVSAALARAAGSRIGRTFPITPMIGGSYSVYAFLICVLGGLGSVPGARLGGMVLALLPVFAGFYWPELKDAISFTILALVLMVRPEGMMGKAFYSGNPE